MSEAEPLGAILRPLLAGCPDAHIVKEGEDDVHIAYHDYLVRVHRTPGCEGSEQNDLFHVDSVLIPQRPDRPTRFRSPKLTRL